MLISSGSAEEQFTAALRGFCELNAREMPPAILSFGTEGIPLFALWREVVHFWGGFEAVTANKLWGCVADAFR